MKKMWLFVLVLVLVLVGCTPTPKVSNAKPTETVAPNLTPEVAVPDFQVADSSELFKLYGDHFLAESLGYSQKDQGTFILVNNTKYLIKDEYMQTEIIDDNGVYMFWANEGPNISITAKGMVFLFETGNGNGPEYFTCFVANIVKPEEENSYNRREFYAQATDNFVPFDQLSGREGNYYITQICRSATLINSPSGEIAILPGMWSVESMQDGNLERWDEDLYNPNIFSVSGYLYHDHSWFTYGNVLLLTSKKLDMDIYSKLAKLLQDNQDKLPEQFLDNNWEEFSFVTEFSTGSCEWFRTFSKIIPEMTQEDIDKACPGTSNFEQLSGISLYTAPDYWMGAVNIDPSSGSNLSYNDQWKVGVGDTLLDGYASQNLKLGTTVLDPFTSITSTGQSCKNILNEDGKLVIIVSTLPDSSESLVECLRKGDYLYLLPTSTLYFGFEVKDQMPKAVVYKLTE